MKLALSLLISLLGLLHAQAATLPAQIPLNAASISKNKTLVPVELVMMSKCPDWFICASIFDRVLKETADKVDLRLSYVAKLDSSTPSGVTCMHGSEECRGNEQQLCFMKRYDWRTAFEFVKCQSFTPKQIGDDSLAKECSSLAGVEWSKTDLQECVDGPEGAELLRASAKDTADRGLKTSCTILINNEQVCKHDGTWKECDAGHDASDFVAQIQDAYKELN